MPKHLVKFGLQERYERLAGVGVTGSAAVSPLTGMNCIPVTGPGISCIIVCNNMTWHGVTLHSNSAISTNPAGSATLHSVVFCTASHMLISFPQPDVTLPCFILLIFNLDCTTLHYSALDATRHVAIRQETT